ncbi:hypothetical protein FA13DRAFT_1730030 [Coprinellus micaceus]|uniref:Uncharacterized protein n=1 Tax=Coprinellus micaceus TaxID=71717 RepID=A0A4Y7THW1_COPMI|nr:hypothetical protein FA13DRAFT_1730030 [Coprinellus micaceus]
MTPPGTWTSEAKGTTCDQKPAVARTPSTIESALMAAVLGFKHMAWPGRCCGWVGQGYFRACLSISRYEIYGSLVPLGQGSKPQDSTVTQP